MSVDQFRHDYFPIPHHRGWTALEAVEFLRRECPQTQQWTCWTPVYLVARLIGQIAGKGYRATGRIGGWTWKRVPTRYPKLAFLDGYNLDPKLSDDWVGLLEIRGDRSERFQLFSFLNSQGEIGRWYLASTLDVHVLDRFAHDLQECFRPADRLVIRVHGGPSIHLDPADDETIFLPDHLRQDIEHQVDSFFVNADRYRQWHLRHRRGFLFVGTPGTGKSLMVRHLVRQCHRRHNVPALMLRIYKRTDDTDLELLFRDAEYNAPCLVILEDLDSLTRECRVSRAHLLGELDGVDSKEGWLVIGTTNNPEDIDPALLHRPSRFDRVWHFELPDRAMRQRYLEWAFPEATANAPTLAEQTDGWSYAYLNELRTTAAILAMGRNAAGPTAEDVRAALARLSPQFECGRRNHAVTRAGNLAGFQE